MYQFVVFLVNNTPQAGRDRTNVMTLQSNPDIVDFLPEEEQEKMKDNEDILLEQVFGKPEGMGRVCG